jgi:hypothetical protein
MAHLPRVALGALLVGGAAGAAPAQEPSTERDYHDRLVALIQRLAPRPLPPGDTSVTWTEGPILYHTVAQSDSVVSSGFLRNDSLIGLETVYWTGGRPDRFTVHWSHRDSTLVKLSGRVEGSQLLIEGTADGTFPLPQLPWAVCDYGMDEHLVPVLQRLARSNSLQQIAVFRPFGFKWDTVIVRVAGGHERSVLVSEVLRADTARWVIAATGELLQLTRDTTLVERRPLEESRLYAPYRRLRATPPELR